MLRLDETKGGNGGSRRGPRVVVLQQHQFLHGGEAGAVEAGGCHGGECRRAHPAVPAPGQLVRPALQFVHLGHERLVIEDEVRRVVIGRPRSHPGRDAPGSERVRTQPPRGRHGCIGHPRDGSVTGVSVHEVGLKVVPGRDRIAFNPLSIRAALAVHRVVVVPGFLAVDRQRVVTLGRGGSDWSAVLLAASSGVGWGIPFWGMPHWDVMPWRIEDRLKALEAGFSTHISKPVEPGELIAAVASVAVPLSRLPAVLPPDDHSSGHVLCDYT